MFKWISIKSYKCIFNFDSNNINLKRKRKELWSIGCNNNCLTNILTDIPSILHPYFIKRNPQTLILSNIILLTRSSFEAHGHLLRSWWMPAFIWIWIPLYHVNDSTRGILPPGFVLFWHFNYKFYTLQFLSQSDVSIFYLVWSLNMNTRFSCHWSVKCYKSSDIWSGRYNFLIDKDKVGISIWK